MMGAILAWALFATLLLVAAASDLRQFRIPNPLPLLLVVGFVLGAAAGVPGLDLFGGLLAGVLMMAVGFVLFLLRAMGGGDVKLMAAASLWVGWGGLAEQVVFVTFIGAVLALGLAAVRYFLARLPATLGCGPVHLPPILQNGQPVPYGVAIALGSLPAAALPFLGG